jgi:hypothetical protein
VSFYELDDEPSGFIKAGTSLTLHYEVGDLNNTINKKCKWLFL